MRHSETPTNMTAGIYVLILNVLCHKLNNNYFLYVREKHNPHLYKKPPRFRERDGMKIRINSRLLFGLAGEHLVRYAVLLCDVCSIGRTFRRRDR